MGQRARRVLGRPKESRRSPCPAAATTYLPGEIASRPSGGIGARLTTKERILLHLLGYVKFSESVEVPQAMSQDGLAAATDIELRHLSQYLRPLLRLGAVRERSAHVEGIRQRRRVYDLTESGKHEAYRLRERVKALTVRVRDGGGEREMTFGEAVASIPEGPSLLDLVRFAEERGVVDLTTIVPAAGVSTLVAMAAEAPKVDRFVGRQTELESITDPKASGRVFVVRGVAGIGKSSLAAKACELLRPTCNVYWHRTRPWDTRRSILVGLGEFLAAAGRPALRARLAEGDAGEPASLLRDELRGIHALLVFDDLQDAAADILPLLRFLKDAVAAAPDARMLVLSRAAVAFYDRRDVSLNGVVREIELRGLSSADLAALLGGDPTFPANVGRRLGGHPLFLELVRASPHPDGVRQALRDQHRFLEEEVYAGLTDPERTTLKIAALYRVPVPRDALLADPVATADVVLSLSNRSLLYATATESFQVHDAIREFLAGLLTPAEREGLARFARAQLRTLADAARGHGDAVECIDYLSNAFQLAAGASDRADLGEALGDACERIGDLPAALTSYREALRYSQSQEARARLHRKMAQALVTHGQIAPARREAEAGLKDLEGLVSPEKGWLDLTLGRAAGAREDWATARERGRAALEAFRSFRDREGEIRALFEMGNTDVEDPRGDPRAAERSFLDALDLLPALDDPELTAHLHIALAHLYGYRFGDMDRTKEHLAAAEAVEAPHIRRSVLMLQAWVHLELLADFPAAERYFREAASLGRRLHYASAAVFSSYGLALSRYFRGDVPGAVADFERFALEAEDMGFLGYSIEGLWMAAEGRLRLGDVDGFRRTFEAAYGEDLKGGRTARPVYAKVFEGVRAVLQGDDVAVRNAFEQALQSAGKGTATEAAVDLCYAHCLYGVALHAAGADAEAAEHARQARGVLDQRHLAARRAAIDTTERELTATMQQARTEH